MKGFKLLMMAQKEKEVLILNGSLKTCPVYSSDQKHK